ncbi:MAG: hypothetical protein J7M11_00560, partial [Elusimicrobia bacterium]|nr:hypothetical protein [Elusimicrobiota bacterium]
MNKNKSERHNPWELFEYSIACLSKKRLATAQAFWAMSFESYVKGRYFEKSKPALEDSKLTFRIMINEISSKNSFRNYTLHELWKKRNLIVHEAFLPKEDFKECLEKSKKLFKNQKTEEEIGYEKQTDLALKFKDRTSYDKKDLESIIPSIDEA